MITRRVANPIAVRRFAVIGQPGREVVLTIGKPRPDPHPGDNWMCSVLIEGIPKERRQRIYGVDAVQTLQLAMVYARRKLDRCGLTLSLGDNPETDEPGNIGLPLPAPGSLGIGFQRKLERDMYRKFKQMSDAVTAVLRERHRRRAGKRSV